MLTGTSGANILRGYGGDDLLRGGDGADKLFGDAGTDTATYYGGAWGVTVNLTSGTGSDGDKLDGIENLTGSNIGGDSLTGTSVANVLKGGAVTTSYSAAPGPTRSTAASEATRRPISTAVRR